MAKTRELAKRVSKNAARTAGRRLLGRPLFRAPLPGFDPVYYLYWYRDVYAAGLDPLQHFLQFGWREGRDPSAGFSTRGYIAANPDVRASGMNPLLHFLEHGLSEGRRGWEKDPLTPPPAPGAPEEPVKLLAPPRRPDQGK